MDGISINPPWPDRDAHQRQWTALCGVVPWLTGFIGRDGQARQPEATDLRAYLLFLACDDSWLDALKCLTSGDLKDAMQTGGDIPFDEPFEGGRA